MLRGWIICGALVAASGVGLGAYHAHGLEQRLTQGVAPADLAKRLDQFEVGVRYQMYHALGMILVGIIAANARGPAVHLTGFAFLAGTALFSGMLYVLALTGQQFHPLLIPVGGLLMIVGWFLFAWAAFRGGSGSHASAVGPRPN